MTLSDRLQALISTLLDIELWVVGAAVFISVIWNNFLPIVIPIALLFWLLRKINKGSFSIRTPNDLSIGILGVMVISSVIVTSLPENTYPQVYRVLTGMLLFYSVVNWTNSKQRLRLIVFIFILAGIIIALIAPFSVTWSTSKILFIPGSFYERFRVILSDTVHPNVMGGNLILLLPLPLSILIFGWKQISIGERLYSGLAVVLMTLVILLTKSRGTWVALTTVMILIMLLRWRISWLFIIIVTGILILAISIPGINEFIEIITANDALIGLEGRIDIWSRSVFMIQDFPITGIGLGMFMDIADNLYTFFLFPAGKIIHAHNLFLQIAVEIGLPGLVAWFAIFLSTSMINWRIFRHGETQGNSLEAGLGVGLLASSLALAVHGLTDAVTWGFIRTAPLVWALWGVTLVIYYLEQYPVILKHPCPLVNRFPILRQQED